MRVVVYMLFDFESLIVCFHHHTKSDVQRFGSLCCFLIIFAVYHKLRIIGILYPCPLIFFVFVYIHTFFHEVFIQFIQYIELTGKVYHRTGFTLLVNHEKWWYTCRTSHVRIIRTKRRCNMNDTCTVFCRYIITRDNTEAFITYFPATVFRYFNRFHPGNQLLIFHTNKVSTFVFGDYFEWYELISCLIIFQFQISSFRIEMSI